MRLAVRGIARGSGYGNVAQELIGAFRGLGVDVVDHDVPAPVLLHVLPPHFMTRKFRGQRAWLLSMWETENCPEGLRAGFGNFEGIVCPTVNNLIAFSQYHPNVHRVNLGVDWRFWSPRPRTVDGPFRFLYTAHSPRRKGGDLAQQAGQILAKTHDVEMVPASAGTDEELRDLFWSCHAYVQASRGEGWGMMPHQAVASGMPAVVSDCPGHREYAHLPGVVVSPTVRVPSALTFHGDPGDWWEPTVDGLVDAMRTVVDRYPLLQADAMRANKVCSVEFDWPSIAAEILGLIGSLDGDCEPVWEDCTFAEFPIVVNRRVSPDIGDRHYEFVPGETYMVTADVKRVLREAGYVAA